MDFILLGAPDVIFYLDDILVTGDINTAHIRKMIEVLIDMKEYAVCLRKEKCHFFGKSVNYLGNTIDVHGVCTSAQKFVAIVEALVSHNV